ncbi:helix-hairpin-helix domain-containing protein [Chitinivorax sp. B]|uniref:ComEA family DNA-binding protein n=1 Tax=Chitinivorax sp. B TaxID=2502235 RepID=UPI0010F75DB4|nr:helix-hairpin-helix domain-containing protein [Chitinivorax sp. B]
MRKLLLTLLTLFTLMGSAFAAVDLNSATQQQLEGLPGIGPAKAKAILDYRQKNGSFKAAEEIMKVPGIKQATYDKIKGELTVGGKGPAKPADAKATKPSEAKKDEKKK